MSRRNLQDLKPLLPKLKEGEVLHVDTGTPDFELVALKDALAALREAKRGCRPVWIVVGEASKKGK